MEGRTYGAHLMDGSEVYTTAEIVLASQTCAFYAFLTPKPDIRNWR